VFDSLAEVRIFSGLSEATLKFLSGRAHFCAARALNVIVQEGDPGDRLFIITSGEVRACRNFASVGEVELARLSAGQCFGEMCILDTLPRSATVQATQDSALRSLDVTTLYELHRTQPAQFSLLVLNVTRDLCWRLRRLDQIFAAWQ
jgi:CRP-like cAMP-binding protein